MMKTSGAPAFVAVVLCCLAGFCSSHTNAQTAELALRTSDDLGLLLVGLLTGELYAIDESTGRMLWMFHTQAPMVSSFAPAAEGENRLSTMFFPGLDGSLYHYNSHREELERLPMTVRSLVHQSPSLTDDGMPVLGEQETMLFYLDKRTGKQLMSFSTSEMAAATVGSGPAEHAIQGMDAGDVLVIGRTVHRVHAWHPISMQMLWNVSFSDWRLMSLPGLEGTSTTLLDVAAGLSEIDDAYNYVVYQSRIRRVARPQHPSVEGVGSADLWSHSFPAPPAFISASRQKTFKQPKPHSPVYLTPSTYLNALEAVKQTKDGALVEARRSQSARRRSSVSVVIGELNGSLYAMPVGRHGPWGTERNLAEILDVPNAHGVKQVTSGIASQALAVASDGRAGRAGFMCMSDDAMRIKRFALPEPGAAEVDVIIDTAGRNMLPPPPDIGGSARNPQQTISNALIVVLILAVFVLAYQMWKYSNQSQQPQHRQQTPGRRRGGPLPGEDPNSPAYSDGLYVERKYAHERCFKGVIQIGALEFKSERVLGYGTSTHGTVVFEGMFAGRPVAVKRMLTQFSDVARKEMDALIKSDEHPNVVRCFAWEQGRDFVYLALELCKMTLYDAFTTPDPRNRFTKDQTPTPLVTQIARDAVEGVQALHNKDIVHRDIKPQNVLLTEQYRGKVGDMGLSKQMEKNQTSFDTIGNTGSYGWRAPEQIQGQEPSTDSGAAGGSNPSAGSGSGCGTTLRQSKAVDVFSLGMVLFWMFTAGKHPFGESGCEREGNILRKEPDLTPLVRMPELHNLLSGMLQRDAKKRPTISEVLAHPFWWSAADRLQFVCDLSDRFELLDRKQDDVALLQELESVCLLIYPTGDNWAASLEPALIRDLDRYRRYNFTKVRDLLRVIRNKYNHYRELDPAVQQLLGEPPDTYYAYFEKRFPALLVSMFCFIVEKRIGDERAFLKYGLSNVGLMAFVEAQRGPPDGAPVVNAAAVSQEGRVGSLNGAAPDPGAEFAVHDANDANTISSTSTSQVSLAVGPVHVPDRHDSPPIASPCGLRTPPAGAVGGGSRPRRRRAQQGRRRNHSVAAVRHGQADLAPGAGEIPDAAGTPGRHDVHDRTQRSVSANCGSIAPGGNAVTAGTGGRQTGGVVDGSAVDGAASQSGVGSEGGEERMVVGWRITDSDEGSFASFPRNPGQAICKFYVSTGHCKFGMSCFKDHPPEYRVKLNRRNLPMRPGVDVCPFYLQNGHCSFNASCKFHHPNLEPVWSA